MANYDPKDLESILVYIESRFGAEFFMQRGRFISIFRNLAPSLKDESEMLDRMSKLGIMDEFVNTSTKDVVVQERLIAKFMDSFTDRAFIQPVIASNYLKV